MDSNMDSIGSPIGFPELGVSSHLPLPVLDFQVWLPCPNLSYGKGLAPFSPWMGWIFLVP